MAKDKKKRPRKLDYICVSNRWKGMVKNVCTRWGPAIHRFGQKFDRGLLSARWRWKTKKTQRYETADFAAMNSQSWQEFDSDLRIRIQEKTQTRAIESGHIGHTESDLSQELEDLTSCTKETIAAMVPKQEKKKKNGRVMSDKTKELHEKRRREFSKKEPTPQERKRWNRRIARQCRKDYRTWVTQWTETIEKEFRAGNAKAIYAGVKSLCGTKQSFATKQPTLNSQGGRIDNPEELASVWKQFLEKKFSPTELEKLRDEFEELPGND